MALLEREILKKVLFPGAYSVFQKFSSWSFLNTFYLAGGTALALSLQHRISEDFDFFTSAFPGKKEFETEILATIQKSASCTILEMKRNTAHLEVEGIRISFLQYDYPLLEPLQSQEAHQALRDLLARKGKRQ